MPDEQKRPSRSLWFFVGLATAAPLNVLNRWLDPRLALSVVHWAFLGLIVLGVPLFAWVFVPAMRRRHGRDARR